MNPTRTGVNVIGQSKVTALFAGDFPVSREEVTLAGGIVYPAGAVLGKATDSGKCSLVDSSKSDGTEKVYAILLHEVDAVEGDKTGIVGMTGEYNLSVKFGGTDTYETHKEDARKLCIFFRAVQPA